MPVSKNHLGATIEWTILPPRITVHLSPSLVRSNCDLGRARRLIQAFHEGFEFRIDLESLAAQHNKLLSKSRGHHPRVAYHGFHRDPVVVPMIAAKGS
jgi:hypothetical protein